MARKGLDQPFLLFGSGDTQRTDPGKEYYDPSWAIITSVMKALVGGAEPQRSVLAQRDYIAAIFDQTLRRRPSLLLRGDSPKFPEVHFAR